MTKRNKSWMCKYPKIVSYHNIGILLVFMEFIMYCIIMLVDMYFIALLTNLFDDILT